MIKIESLKDYIGTINEKDFLKLASDVYMITEFICEDYPNHKEWYFKKQLPAIIGEERNILFARNDKNKSEIISVAFLKKDKEEKKICTLYVSDKYRNLGVGTEIINKSIQWLGTTKPLITIADYKLDMFKPIIKKYNWELTEIVSGIYNENHKELCFNGTLTKNNENTVTKSLHKRLIRALNNRKEQLK